MAQRAAFRISLKQRAVPQLSSSALFTWLKIGVVIVNLFVVGSTIWTIQHNRAQDQLRAEITTRNLAQTLENQIVGAMTTHETALLAVMDEYQRQRAEGQVDGKAMNAYIEQVVARLPEVDALRITDANGALVYGSGIKPGTTTNLADRPHFIRLREDCTAGLVISQPQISRINRKWVIVLARRINQADGTFDGMAFVAITLDHLSKSFSALQVGRNGVITLRDEGMRLVARYPQVPATNGAIGSTATAAAFKERIGAGQSDATLVATSLLDGVERTYSYRQVGSHPLYIFVGLSPRDYLFEWRRMSLLQALIAGLFILMATLATMLMHRAWRQHFNLVESLAESEARLRETIDSALDAVVSIDGSGRLIDFNPAAETMFGWKKQEVLGRMMGQVLIPDTHREAHEKGLARYAKTGEVKIMNQRIETTAMRRDGTIFPIELAITAIRRKKEEIFTAYLRDISARKEMEEEVRQLAFYDPLTKLPNRRLVKDRLSQARAASRRSGCHGAVIFLDLDNFKPLNDDHGHDVGDLLLIEVAKRLTGCVREMDTVARFGGDEFVVIVSKLTEDRAESALEARIVAEKIRARLSEPYLLAIKRAGKPTTTVEHRCTASIGVTLFSGDNASEDDWLKWADMAMYQAKATGNLFVFHDQ